MNSVSVGEKLRSLRGDKPLPLVALQLGVSESALSLYETDRRIPRDEVKLRLCDFYGLSLDQLFFESEVHAS